MFSAGCLLVKSYCLKRRLQQDVLQQEDILKKCLAKQYLRQDVLQPEDVLLAKKYLAK